MLINEPLRVLAAVEEVTPLICVQDQRLADTNAPVSDYLVKEVSNLVKEFSNILLPNFENLSTLKKSSRPPNSKNRR